MTDKTIVKVERTGELAKVKANMQIVGLEDVPTSIIPLPFYKLVQPGSTNVQLGDKTDAVPGSIYMDDTGTATLTLHCAVLRVKHNIQEFKDFKSGDVTRKMSYNVLGINLENYTPFILSVGVSSFNNFGKLMKQLKDLKVSNAWEYGVTVTSEKREEEKDTPTGRKKVKYFVMNFKVDDKKFDESGLSMLEDAYSEFAASLDRGEEPQNNKVESVTTEEASKGGGGIPF